MKTTTNIPNTNADRSDRYADRPNDDKSDLIIILCIHLQKGTNRTLKIWTIITSQKCFRYF